MTKKFISFAKRKRHEQFKKAIRIMHEYDVSLGSAMSKVKHGRFKFNDRFLEGDNPNMQVCNYQPLGYGVHWCSIPCNGDC